MDKDRTVLRLKYAGIPGHSHWAQPLGTATGDSHWAQPQGALGGSVLLCLALHRAGYRARHRAGHKVGTVLECWAQCRTEPQKVVSAWSACAEASGSLCSSCSCSAASSFCSASAATAAPVSWCGVCGRSAGERALEPRAMQHLRKAISQAESAPQGGHLIHASPPQRTAIAGLTR